jgi:hypothetical protein
MLVICMSGTHRCLKVAPVPRGSAGSGVLTWGAALSPPRLTCRLVGASSPPDGWSEPGDRDDQGNQGARGDLVIGGKGHATHKVSMRLISSFHLAHEACSVAKSAGRAPWRW